MKHAILILAHNNFNVVETLIKQFDAPEFDIYIHINAKIKKFPCDKWKSVVKHTNLYFVERKKIVYCDYSMLEGVKSLFNSALKSRYDYYHLISGADILIKTRVQFLEFFEENRGKEFVGFSDSYNNNSVAYRNYFVGLCRQKSRFWSLVFIKIRYTLINIQRAFKIKNVPDYIVKKGNDWYSVTHDAAQYLMTNEPKFKKWFFRAYCPTEFFAQTILFNSHFKENLYCYNIKDSNIQSMREIDWKRGLPYVFKIEDFDFLMKSKAMFARKFDENIDFAIVKKIENSLNKKEG